MKRFVLSLQFILVFACIGLSQNRTPEDLEESLDRALLKLDSIVQNIDFEDITKNIELPDDLDIEAMQKGMTRSLQKLEDTDLTEIKKYLEDLEVEMSKLLQDVPDIDSLWPKIQQFFPVKPYQLEPERDNIDKENDNPIQKI